MSGEPRPVMPPEWAPHARTWMEFPPANDTFSHDLPRFRAAWTNVANAIVQYEPVTVIADPPDAAAARALLVRACYELDLGEHASDSTSIAKTFGAEAFVRVADRAMQMCGGLGVSEDLPLARLAAELRPFRIYDGPSEVHRWAIAKRAVGRVRKAREAQ